MTRIFALPPWIDAGSQVLVLGSMPSARSLAEHCYYAHPRNRFWPIIARLCGRELADAAQRREALRQLGLAVYDVISSCERRTSADHDISHAELADIASLLAGHPHIRRVVTNGRTASDLYRRHFAALDCEHVPLPSTSPANARCSLQQLTALYAAALCPQRHLPPQA